MKNEYDVCPMYAPWQFSQKRAQIKTRLKRLHGTCRVCLVPLVQGFSIQLTFDFDKSIN